MKNDRITGGAIAGIIGAIVQDVYGIIVKATGLTKVAFIDFAKVIAFGKPTPGIIATITGTLAHLTLEMILGTIFALIIMKSSSKYFLLKSLGYGAALSFIGALVFGLFNGYALKLIQDKTSLV